MNNLKNSNILITGGAGFIGSWTIDNLVNEKVKSITVIDNFSRGSKDNLKNLIKSQRIKLVKGDIRDRKLVSRLFKGIDYCIHLAALRITQCAQDPREAFEVLFEGSFNVFTQAAENKIKKLVSASSASIYGMAEVFPTPEYHHPYNNRTLYGAGKLANEQLLRSFNEMHGLNYTSLRYFNVYGPRMDTYGKYTEVLIRWYKAIKQNQPPLIYGKGEQTMDFVYVEDVALANVLSLKSNISDEVFNIGTGKETSLNTLCNMLIKTMSSNLKPKHIHIPKSRSKVEVTRRQADTTKTAKLIKFNAKTDLSKGLKKLVLWLENQRI